MRLLLWSFFVVCWAGWGSAARILAFFPFAAKSHHILFEPWIRALCRRGHQVTYLSPTQFKGDIPNLEKIPLKDFWPPIEKKLYKSLVQDNRSSLTSAILLQDSLHQLGNASLRSQEFQDLIQSKRHYDAVITESWFGQEYSSVLSHRFNALNIVIQTFGGHSWSNEMSGLPDNPSWMYDVRYFKAEHPNNVFERLYNLYTTATIVGLSYWNVQTKSQSLVDEVVRYPGWESRPRLTMLASDVALVLRNNHFSLGFPAPAAPHVKDVGGLNVDFDLQTKPQLLNTAQFAKCKEFLDNSTNGFIYFSLGSIVNPTLMLPAGSFKKLYKAMAKLNVNVLMKWNDDVIPETPSPNILLSKEFLPQMEILAHKNIRAFATHGGLLSISEAVHFGVPLIGMPVFGDQPMNVKRAISHGYGIQLSIMNPHLTESLITLTVSKVLKNPTYKVEAMRKSALFKDRIMKPVDEAVYWTEYVLKHGNVLQPMSARMPFYQLYLLDVLATLLFGFLLTAYAVKKLLFFFIMFKSNKVPASQNQKSDSRTMKKSKKE